MQNNPANASATKPNDSSSPSLDPGPTQDLHYLLELGVPVENIAHRIGRTPTAVHHHIRTEQEEIENAT